MNTAAKVSAFGGALVLIFGAAWAAGAAAGPLGSAPAPSAEPVAESVPDRLDGLTDTANGYRLALAEQQFQPGVPGTLSFRVLDRAGTPVTAFAVDHERALNLIVVRRDGTGYEHLRPELAVDGTWTAQVTPAVAGSYRLIADVTPLDGPQTVLGADVSVAGQFTPVPHELSRTFAFDGYRVELTGDLRAGTASELTATVSRDGAPVADLEPYLGAHGHLVALRSPGLGYLRVHSAGGAAGPAIRFTADVPREGRYRLFLDFRHGGRPHTADFTLDTVGAQPVPGHPSAEHGHSMDNMDNMGGTP